MSESSGEKRHIPSQYFSECSCGWNQELPSEGTAYAAYKNWRDHEAVAPSSGAPSGKCTCVGEPEDAYCEVHGAHAAEPVRGDVPSRKELHDKLREKGDLIFKELNGGEYWKLWTHTLAPLCSGILRECAADQSVAQPSAPKLPLTEQEADEQRFEDGLLKYSKYAAPVAQPDLRALNAEEEFEKWRQRGHGFIPGQHDAFIAGFEAAQGKGNAGAGG